MSPPVATPLARPRSPLRERVAAWLDHLETGLVERRGIVRLALLAALAGEHTLLVGPPGTAKSELARRLHLAFAHAGYFERLLTRFTVPEELFGPLSISGLEQDRYERITEGFLPRATIAFIDEVFKANSAILNALLTLLNEREFDNGTRREHCPLVSVIGATNEIPDDEVADAFLDRFLMRLHVGPVSAQGFARLLSRDETLPAPTAAPFTEQDLASLWAVASTVTLPEEVVRVLGELREQLARDTVYVSDRRWVDAARLLKVAAAAQGRCCVVLWDTWLLPWCLAPDVAHQTALSDWLCARLGIDPAMSPPLLTRVVEAFEAQAQLEQQAEDLDYDESGRLKFSTELDENVNDAKGGAQAQRMSFHRRRRYGTCHIHARTAQVDELIARLDACSDTLSAHLNDLHAWARENLWMDGDFEHRAASSLTAAIEDVARLRERAHLARAAFDALPRLACDSGVAPAPVAYETLAIRP